MDHETNDHLSPEILANDVSVHTTIESLLSRIQHLESQLASKPATTNAPREICKRNHSTDNWQTTPRGVRYCKSCYRELRLEQAERKLRQLGRI